jgi:DNA mismatch repair ATPase MutL
MITLVGTGLIVVFDQHAAHERVRLEELTKGTLCVNVVTSQKS